MTAVPDHRPHPDRRLSVLVLVIGGVLLVALAAVLVPWDWVPGGRLPRIAPGDVFTAREIARAEQYDAAQRHLSWAGYAVSLAVALLLGLTRLGARLVGRVRGWWWWRVLVGTAAVLLIGRVVTLPFGWALHDNAVDAGLSTQSPAAWWRDVAVSFGVSWATTAVALLALVGIARRSPRRWPVWAAGAVAALGLLGSFVYPVVVEPLFNDFRSLQHGVLREQILTIADREGVDVSDVLVADASRRTTTLNAYVSGFGSTRRVVLYDTLLDNAPREEVLLVVAHELGHAKHHDVLVGTVLGVAAGAAGVGLLGLVLSSARLRRRAGVAGAADPAAVPLVLALVAVGMFLASPAQNTMSRAVEARADRTSLAATHDVDGFVALQRRLAVSSRSDPSPPLWGQFWFGSHPTALQRIGIARALDAHPG